MFMQIAIDQALYFFTLFEKVAEQAVFGAGANRIKLLAVRITHVHNRLR